jgi:hypothetical protein
MGRQREGRAGHRRSLRVMSIGLAAMLATTMALPAAFADEHEGVYPPVPDYEIELVCVPEAVQPAGTVTCTASGADGVAQLRVYASVIRPPAGWDGTPPDWDWQAGDVDRDEADVRDEHWGEVELSVAVGTDGTAVFSFDVPADARDGDWYEVYAYVFGEDCIVEDLDTYELLGRGAFEGEDDDGFVIDGVPYSRADAHYYCLQQDGGYTFGRIAGLDEDAGEDGEEGAPAPGPEAPRGPTTLPTTGGATLLLALWSLAALGGGATALAGGRRLARGNR